MPDNQRAGAGGVQQQVAEDAPPVSTELASGPRHVAIIMDGNGRWAVDRGLPRVAGHQAGVEALRRTVKACPELGIKFLTVYAFSTENWKRPKAEVEALLELLTEYSRREVDSLAENGVSVRVIGRMQDLQPLQRAALELVMARTAGGDRLQLNMALNYGSHLELVDAIRAIVAEVQAGRLQPEAVDAHCIEEHLYTAGIPNPDLIIRTGGEMRLSNFLLWQSAYAEFWVTPVYWPEFGRTLLEQAVSEYGQRERRFGAVSAHHG